MAPIKFEKHIKDKLDERKIRPSLVAWEQISQKIKTDTNSGKRNFFWYSVAAGFIGFLLVTVLYLKNDTAGVDQENQIVNEPSNNEMETEASFKIEAEKTLDSSATITAVATNDQEEPEAIKSEVPVSHQVNDFEKIETKPVVSNDEIAVSESEEAIIDTKIAQILEQVNGLEENNEALNDAEVDSLLRQAQKEMLADRLFNSNGKVDATALLSEVEEELDQSFRDQIFERLKTGFIKVRTAVADRNN